MLTVEKACAAGIGGLVDHLGPYWPTAGADQGPAAKSGRFASLDKLDLCQGSMTHPMSPEDRHFA